MEHPGKYLSLNKKSLALKNTQKYSLGAHSLAFLFLFNSSIILMAN